MIPMLIRKGNKQFWGRSIENTKPFGGGKTWVKKRIISRVKIRNISNHHPETLPSLKLTWHLKMDGWNTCFLFGNPIFRCYVSFREGRVHSFSENVETFSYQAHFFQSSTIHITEPECLLHFLRNGYLNAKNHLQGERIGSKTNGSLYPKMTAAAWAIFATSERKLTDTLQLQRHEELHILEIFKRCRRMWIWTKLLRNNIFFFGIHESSKRQCRMDENNAVLHIFILEDVKLLWAMLTGDCFFAILS